MGSYRDATLSLLVLIAANDVLLSCKAQDADAKTARIKGRIQDLQSTEVFFRAAQEGANQRDREQAAAHLKQEFALAFENFKSTTAEAIRQRVLTQKILNMSADVVAGNGAHCLPEEHIRAYRAFDDSPMIGPNNASKGLVLNNPWNEILSEDLKTLEKRFVSSSGVTLGTFLYETSSSLKKGKLHHLPWSLWFGDRRYSTKDQAATPEGRWNALVAQYFSHPNSSPLLGVSLNHEIVAETKKSIMVLELCPERVFFAASNMQAQAQELVVPLFLLPEEIVRIEPPCKGSTANCESTSDTKAAPSTMTRLYQKCYENMLTGTNKAFYDLLFESNITDWHENVKALKEECE